MRARPTRTRGGPQASAPAATFCKRPTTSDRLEREADAHAERAVNARADRAVNGHAAFDWSRVPVGRAPSPAPGLAGGRPLAPELRGYFEPRLGGSLGDVRIHDDPAAHQQAEALGARAFTVGRDIAFAAGQHDPESSDGRRLIAHELAHVVQQASGAASGVQCQLFDDVTPSAESPGLSQEVARLVHAAIARGDKQGAVDLVVDEMVRTGQIDRTLLLGGRVHYQPGLAGEGATTRRNFRRDPSTSALTALRRPIRIGDDAFRNVPWLYSSILHEYQHVLQTERPSGLPTTTSVVPGQQPARVYRMQRDVEAYATEILRSDQTGVDKHPRDIRDLWERLHDAWSILSLAQKDPLKDLYRSAHARAVSIPGVGPLPHFTPIP